MKQRIGLIYLASLIILTGFSSCNNYQVNQNTSSAIEDSINDNYQAASEAVPSVATSEINVAQDGQWVLAYPDRLPQGVQNSSAYKTAEKRNALISNGWEPATSGALARKFIEDVNEGKDATLYIYWFYQESHCVTKLEFYKGRLAEVYQDYPGWDSVEEFTAMPMEVKKIRLNKYGYLVCEYMGDYRSDGKRVINSKEIYKDFEELQNLYSQYLMGVEFALGKNYWKNGDPNSNLLLLFSGIEMAYMGGQSLYENRTNWSVTEVYNALSHYFDGITREKIISGFQNQYNPISDSINYAVPESVTNNAEPTAVRVTDWRYNKNLLKIYYQVYNQMTGDPIENADCVLEVKQFEDGSFHYLSNQPDTEKKADKNDDIAYWDKFEENNSSSSSLQDMTSSQDSEPSVDEPTIPPTGKK